MSWFEKLIPSRISTFQKKKNVPEGIWVKCAKCDAQLYRAELERNLKAVSYTHLRAHETLR